MTNYKIIGNIPKHFKSSEKQIESVLNNSLLKLSIKKDSEIEIVFVSENKIKKMNAKYRNTAKSTDILSFPQRQIEGLKFNILGSIVICGKIAKERSENLPDLLKHGLLHLLSYDHENNLAEWDKAVQIIDCTF